jgi:hypothetical protein
LNVDNTVFDLLMEAFSLLQIDNSEKLFSLFPHYIAEFCENTDDKERRRYLFFYLIHACLATESFRALKRVLRGEHKGKYIELVKEFRARVDSMQRYYPPWVSGRLRALIANMRVV